MMKRIQPHALIRQSVLGMATLVITGFTIGTAQANDTCKNVKITMSNNTSDEIKLTKLEYKDFDKGKWNTENAFGVDGIQKLEHGVSMNTTRDLQNVGNDKTELRVTYQHHMGGTKWGDKITVTGDQFTCKNEGTHTVSLTK
jgi:hypothetical protein